MNPACGGVVLPQVDVGAWREAHRALQCWCMHACMGRAHTSGFTPSHPTSCMHAVCVSIMLHDSCTLARSHRELHAHLQLPRGFCQASLLHPHPAVKRSPLHCTMCGNVVQEPDLGSANAGLMNDPNGLWIDYVTIRSMALQVRYSQGRTR